MDSNSITELEKMIKITEEKIKNQIQQYPGIPKIILLGNTGSGKSSLAYALTNNILKIENGPGKKVILQLQNVQNDKIVNQREANIQYDEQLNLLFCDCPGFDDENEFDEDVIDSIAIDSIVQNYTQQEDKLKILLVISSWEFESKRGKEIAKLLERIQQMFPNQEELQNGMAIIITKGDAGTAGIDYIDRLKERASEELKEVCNYFLNKSDIIFTFPQASLDKIGETYEFEDKEKLLKFIKSDYILNLEHNVSLGESSMKQIKKNISQNSQKIDIVVNRIFEELAKKYQSENNIDDFKKWLNLLKAMQESNINNSNEFKQYIQNNFPPIPRFQLNLNQIEMYESINNSLFGMLKYRPQNSYISQIIEFHTNKAINEIDNLLKKYQQIEEKQIIIKEKQQIEEQMNRKQKEDEETVALYQKKIEEDKLLEAKQQEELRRLENEKQKRMQELEKERKAKNMHNINNEDSYSNYYPDQIDVNQFEHINEMPGYQNVSLINQQKFIEEQIKFENEKQQWAKQKRYDEQYIQNEKRKIKLQQQQENMKRWNEESRYYDNIMAQENARRNNKQCLLI